MENWRLNERAEQILREALAEGGERWRVRCHPAGAKVAGSVQPRHQASAGSGGQAWVVDAGVEAEGGIEAGLLLARVCLADMAQVQLGLWGDGPWPGVIVHTDQPVVACLLSQYAGWQIQVGKFFAMGSGPMRAMYAREKLFEELGYRESAAVAVGVLECDKLPGEEVIAFLVEKLGVPAGGLRLLAAATASLAGMIQVAARSVETALHKLHELGYPLSEIVSGWGVAPLLPVAKGTLAAIGRSNDAVLYGARVWLWVRSEDERLAEVGPRVPSCASSAFGRPFVEILKEAGGDFYRIDPMLFSPAEVHFCNLRSGRSFRFGQVRPDILLRSLEA
ncbi:MAG: methenyltetrahydromethanopterin cyclohydrolase [Gemmatales bacterium]|nr:methenyltetrahydromethanopterin cyclohydrolase [Gemmatales bacterium]MDW7993513.1 methenyltetrahydromethanopterin cyclohydrolase [Gemmatales bacterium]